MLFYSVKQHLKAKVFSRSCEEIVEEKELNWDLKENIEKLLLFLT